MEIREEELVYSNNSSRGLGVVYGGSRKQPKRFTFTPHPQQIYISALESPIITAIPSPKRPNIMSKSIEEPKQRTKSQLLLYNQALDDLKNTIKPSNNEAKEEEKLQLRTTPLLTFDPSLTNTQVVTDFYDYTENCFRLIIKIEKRKEYIGDKAFFGFNMKEKKRIVALDLDETLIHCTSGKEKKGEHTLSVLLPGNKIVPIWINIRPKWKELIENIRKDYHVVVYTASHKSYADAVLNYMDPKNEYFPHRLYRSNCIQEEIDNQKFYIKDMEIFAEAGLKDVVIVDNSVLSFAYHLDNGIPIIPFYDNPKDNDLEFISDFLASAIGYEDLRKANKEQIQLSLFYNKAKIEAEEEENEEEEEYESDEEESEEDSVESAKEDGPHLSPAKFQRTNDKRKQTISQGFQNVFKSMRKSVTGDHFNTILQSNAS